ncbi:MAG: sugar ABC transporter substrate-binding protein [Clostridiaceae bacterium]|nr:sugar ABC transporter substrate-binding protein [Clostridiaceae bacterium]
MKNTVRKVILTSALFISMLLLTACQKSAEQGSDNNTIDSQAEQAGNKKAGEEELELVLWHHETPAHRIKAWQAVMDGFMAENPGIKVTQEAVLWDDAMQKLLSATRAGTLPDIHAVSDAQWSTSFLAGSIIPIDDIVKEIDEAEQFNPDSLKSYHYDGHDWAVPINSSTINLMYRPSLLKKAGYDRPPETWSELLEYAKNCTFDENGDGTPEVYGIGMAAGRNTCTNETFSAFLISKNYDIFNEQGEVVFDSPQVIETAEYYQKLLQYSSPSSTSWSYGEIEMNFAAGNLAMIPYISPNLPAFFEEGIYDVATAPMPHPDDMTAEDSPKYIANHALNVTIAAKEPERYEAVKKLLKYMMEPENIWILTLGQEPGFFVPPTKTGMDLVKSGYINKDFLPLKDFDDADGSEHRKILENFTEVGSGFNWKGYATGNKYGAVNLSMTEINGSFVVADMIQKIVVDQVSIPEAVKWAQGKMVEISEQSKSMNN